MNAVETNKRVHRVQQAGGNGGGGEGASDTPYEEERRIEININDRARLLNDMGYA